MNYLTQVQTGIDYIEENLDYELTLQAIAQKAGISQWHFQRIFKALTNETIKTYIRSRRLANAFEKLLTTNQKIIEIAITAGFESQQSFSRAFKKAFDMTPNEARKLTNKSIFLKKVEFNQDYLKHINKNISLEPKIITQKKRTLVGLHTQFYSVDSEKNNIADKLPALWDDFLPRMAEIKHSVVGQSYGVIRQTPDKTDLLEYYAALEVSKVDAIPRRLSEN